MKEGSDNLGVDDDAENDNGTKKRLCIFFKKFLGLCSWIWVCVLGSGFVHLLFLFNTYLNLNSYNF